MVQSFNPYRVFWFAATASLMMKSCHVRPVSIPIGFSGSLQLLVVRGIGSPAMWVSIPIGFSGSLQRGGRLHFRPPFHRFNPYRVFWFAATAGKGSRFQDLDGVSIPIGFSGSLQLWACDRLERSRIRFNPYRVFWFAATNMRKNILLSQEAFQSLSGFLVRCNLSHEGLFSDHHRSFNPYRVFWFAATVRPPQLPDRDRQVSIPIGFSGSLQRTRRRWLRL